MSPTPPPPPPPPQPDAPLPPADTSPDIETASDGYATRFSGPVGAWFLERQAADTLELLRPWPGCSVLELGGGHAQLAPDLAAAGHQVTVQGSHAVCEERLRRAMAPGSYAFAVSPLTALPWPDRSFDVALGVRLMAHVPAWPAMLAEMARVARRAVIIDYPDLRSFNVISERLFAAKKAVEKNTRPFQCFQRDQVAAELAKLGLTRLEARPQFFWPMALHRPLGKLAGTAGPSRSLEGLAKSLGLTRAFGSPVILRADRASA